ncbi:hypothetical protein ASG31_10490 [Chryseobacterium sp. Leaf404]|uniref:hypothetical protein n=1 Tax=unclassified Chryseobacterium TaxID=2593645 RepID=UPI0006F91108|nr:MULTISPECIES: hypothetical protein [unclassified Chryseobacterium]KQT16798.1 hypothetical protein ASG31_10490 [Chryseobacterium sp. Leaf404]
MRQFFSDPELSFNKIVFQNRNKAYGAYDLRTEYNRILAKAFFLSLTAIAGISLTAFVINSGREAAAVPTGTVIELTHVDYEEPVKPDVVKPITVTPPAQNVKTYNAQELTPTRNADDSRVKTKKPDNAVAGTVDNPTGVVPTTPNPQTDVTPNNNSTAQLPKADPVVPKAKPDVVGQGGLRVAADFDGGIDAFRNKVMNKFDTESFTDEEVLSTTVTFIVEKNGTISNLKANGKNAAFNKEAIRTIMEVKGKWSPGIDMDGDIVRSYFSFPIKMKFDQ